METNVAVQQRLDTLHRDLSDMKRSNDENNESLRKDIRGISDKLTLFGEKFAHLDGLNYGKQIEKLEKNEEDMCKKIDALQSYQNKTVGAVGVLYVLATALLTALLSYIL